MDPIDSHLLYAGAHADDNYDGGLYRSTNSGNTWTSIGPFTRVDVYMLAVAPTGTVYEIGAPHLTSEPSSVFRSTDLGATWHGVSGLYPNTVAFDARGVTYAAGPAGWFAPSGLFVSTDDGVIWRKANSEGLPYFTVLCLAVDPSGRYRHAGTIISGVFDFTKP